MSELSGGIPQPVWSVVLDRCSQCQSVQSEERSVSAFRGHRPRAGLSKSGGNTWREKIMPHVEPKPVLPVEPGSFAKVLLVPQVLMEVSLPALCG